VIGSGPEVDTICLASLTLLIRIKAEEILWRERREGEVLGEGGGEVDLVDMMKGMVKDKSRQPHTGLIYDGTGRRRARNREMPSLHNLRFFLCDSPSHFCSHIQAGVWCLRERDHLVTLRPSDFLLLSLSFLDDDTHDGRPKLARRSRHRAPSLSSRTHFVHLRIAFLRDRRRDCPSLPTLRKVSPQDN